MSVTGRGRKGRARLNIALGRLTALLALMCSRSHSLRQDDEDLFAEERGGFIPASVRTRLNVLEACPLNVPELAYAG